MNNEPSWREMFPPTNLPITEDGWEIYLTHGNVQTQRKLGVNGYIYRKVTL